MEELDHYHHHSSFNQEGCWGTTDDFATSFLHIYVQVNLSSKTTPPLKPQAEKIIAEEQAGFSAGKSTTEQIFNLRILCEKYLQQQQDLYHVFTNFKKTFERF